MAIKFADLESTRPSREIESIKKVPLDYGNGVIVQARKVTLKGDETGYVTDERWTDFLNAAKENAEGNAELPENWKIGRAKNGLTHGYWYDSDVLTGTSNSAKELDI